MRYLAIAAFVFAIAVPAVLGLRRCPRGRAIGIGWGFLVTVSVSVAVLGYWYPRAFGWTAAEVRSPDAPDVIPMAIFAFIVATASYAVGAVVSAFFPAVRRPLFARKSRGAAGGR